MENEVADTSKLLDELEVKTGECDLCGQWSSDLVFAECGWCRNVYGHDEYITEEVSRV